MSELHEYKCPACGGILEFNAENQNLKCPYCDNEISVAEYEKLNQNTDTEKNEELKWGTSAGGSWDEGELDGMHLYSCSSCGGEIVGDETIGSLSCPYCGSPVVIKGQFSGDLKPDFVIPFKLDKKQAKEKVREYIAKKSYVPKMFKDENHIDEIKGVYVPFWLFDAEVHADMTFSCSNIRVWSDSKYNYTETSTYRASRSGSISFSDLPVDGSSKMEDDLMESIEPFDYNELKPYQGAYMAGYMAERYDVNEEESISRANERIRESTISSFAGTVTGYDNVSCETTELQMKNGTAKYALLPVWILNSSYRGENYKFAVNGQSGKACGDMPVDEGALWRYFGICTGISGIILTALMWFML